MFDDVAKFSRDQHQSEVGQVFSAGDRRYELMGKVDNGAIGMVRKARDLKTQEVVAVKFLAPEFRYIEASSWGDIRERFRREGQRGAGLEHPNLVKILAYEENADASNFEGADHPCDPFIVMDFVEGKTLDRYIKAQSKRLGTGTISVTLQTLGIASAITEALAHLHRRSIVHRDVIPANIFLSPNVWSGGDEATKLGDFGVVKWNDFLASLNTGQLTTSGQVGLGTQKYMSPEQMTKPKDVLAASDMFSLGATFYELFTSQLFDNNMYFLMVTFARTKRGDTYSRCYELGLGMIPADCEPLFESILDLLALGPTTRPTANRIQGKLRFLQERLTATPEMFSS